MSRVRARLLIFIFIQFIAIAGVSAQTGDPRARDDEWKGYKIPAADFKRNVVNKTVLFRVPAAWERAGQTEFKGPHETELRVIVEKVPDGIPLVSYTNAVLQGLRNVPGGADSLTLTHFDRLRPLGRPRRACTRYAEKKQLDHLRKFIL